jgi:hypothetical protein
MCIEILAQPVVNRLGNLLLIAVAAQQTLFTGVTDKPEIFSDPAMSQQEALSYLLRGQGLDSNQSDSAAMTSMLVGLGVAQSGQVVGKIGETFGVSNLALITLNDTLVSFSRLFANTVRYHHWHQCRRPAACPDRTV